ncbi:efflux RND transporter periplasmic adaptor subunit [Pseudoduganella sp. FT55W]|uniref:Efflux RND transporter periplasmic adaptor subunit n=1 Tax=Duganella rivi TaxID=2666083 RepID=A0A7X4GPM8_9BURK|nr:efflux RND transporter periplasmic adaptor subunit [Duganella rivi]MYM67316.1 efflux RND transporter periplasmic adaptor subunit [Duganella rivi]
MGINRRGFLAGAGLTLAAISVVGYKYGHVALKPTAAPMDSAHATYTCSMHPQVVQDKPGTCPICNMNLVRTQGGEAPKHDQHDHHMVHVDAATQQRMGVQLAAVSMAEMNRTVRAYATLSADESTTVAVNPKVEGWLRRVHVQGVGQPVRRGQVLYEIYSPELQQRQREYIDLLTRKDGLLGGDSMTVVGSNAAMVGSLSKEKFRARSRLLAADLSEDLVAQLEKTRRIIDVVPVRAERDGVVTQLTLHEGNYVNPMQQILTYADYSTVWAEVSLFPDQLEWVHNGDTVQFRSGIDKSAMQRAKIELSTLQIDPATRTAKLRMALKNPRGAFRPGAFADVEILSAPQRNLAVPRDAVVRTGRGDFVVVADSGDHFRRVKVSTGLETDDLVAINNGLKEGEKVAVNGQFLLDGATRTAAAPMLASLAMEMK